MAGPLRAGHHHDPRHEPPFWARTRIDHRGLDTVTFLAYSLAQRWVPEKTARAFSRTVNVATATMVEPEPGEATFNLWEDPGGLVCRVVRGADDPAAGPHRSPAGGRDPWPDGVPGSGIAMHLADDAAMVRLTV